ncbi:hypothetical protein DY218_23445 [Streptomyces triticagri]|uniref:Uncharacterized protein n=1 Tax=Streptomyces triticagri TaxID=2293568 RepID=A0A372M0P0_9ACTN|nr:hypothetical protein [Streptomyces triticagri]RFU84180.1 hypothetical protein DY218_23445 [Streptomyces triticagri]
MTKRGNSERKRRTRELKGHGLSYTQALRVLDRTRETPSRIVRYLTVPDDAAMTAVELLARARGPVPDELAAELLAAAGFTAQLAETWQDGPRRIGGGLPGHGVRIDLDRVRFTLADRSERTLWTVTEVRRGSSPGTDGDVSLRTYADEKRARNAWRQARTRWRGASAPGGPSGARHAVGSVPRSGTRPPRL